MQLTVGLVEKLKPHAGLSHDWVFDTGLCTNIFRDCITKEEATAAANKALSRKEVAIINLRVQTAWDKTKELHMPNTLTGNPKKQTKERKANPKKTGSPKKKKAGPKNKASPKKGSQNRTGKKDKKMRRKQPKASAPTAKAGSAASQITTRAASRWDLMAGCGSATTARPRRRRPR